MFLLFHCWRLSLSLLFYPSLWANDLCGGLLDRVREKAHTVHGKCLKSHSRSGLEPATFHTTQARSPRSNQLSLELVTYSYQPVLLHRGKTCTQDRTRRSLLLVNLIKREGLRYNRYNYVLSLLLVFFHYCSKEKKPYLWWLNWWNVRRKLIPFRTSSCVCIIKISNN